MDNFILRERTVVIAGPFSTLTQSMMMGLAGMGADVALVGPSADRADRFCGQVSDQREINPKHGRARAAKLDFTKANEIKDVLGQIAQGFGGIDILIDAQIFQEPSPVKFTELGEDFLAIMDQSLKGTLAVTQSIVGYLKSRKKGRILYLIPETYFQGDPVDAVAAAARAGLVQYSLALSNLLKTENVTVNSLRIGITEEYLMGHYPGISVKEALAEKQKSNPFHRLLEPDRLTSALGFFLGPQGQGITGQSLVVG